MHNVLCMILLDVYKIMMQERRGKMLTEKELLLMEDFLNAAQSSSDSMNNLANSLQDAQTKQLFQQISQKNSQNAQMISKHLNAGQNIQ